MPGRCAGSAPRRPAACRCRRDTSSRRAAGCCRSTPIRQSEDRRSVRTTVQVDAEVIEQIRALDGDFRFDTWMSLTCHNCPDVVQAMNLMAVFNPRIRAVAIDGGLFQA